MKKEKNIEDSLKKEILKGVESIVDEYNKYPFDEHYKQIMFELTKFYIEKDSNGKEACSEVRKYLAEKWTKEFNKSNENEIDLKGYLRVVGGMLAGATAGFLTSEMYKSCAVALVLTATTFIALHYLNKRPEEESNTLENRRNNLMLDNVSWNKVFYSLRSDIELIAEPAYDD